MYWNKVVRGGVITTMESTLQVTSGWTADEDLLIGSPGSGDEIRQDEIDARLQKSMADISEGKVLSQDQLDDKMGERFASR